jgi:hypothetical protein
MKNVSIIYDEKNMLIGITDDTYTKNFYKKRALK